MIENILNAGSFSRTAVNFSAGCETAVSNIVMAVTVLISLEFFTRLLYFTPVAILASIILSALPGLINLSEAKYIWKVDKMDFLTCAAAFLGVLFVSVEIGLLLAVGISFAKIILNSVQPGTEKLGRLPGSDLFGDVEQYPIASTTPGALIVRVKSALLCFANANFIRGRILNLALKEHDEDVVENGDQDRVKLVILDMSNLLNIDTSSIASLEELQNELESNGMQLALANPRWHVIHKLKLANFLKKIEGRIFLTIGEAIEACLTNDDQTPTPIGASNTVVSFSQSTQSGNRQNDEIGFYKGMSYKDKDKLSTLFIACLKKDFRIMKVINSSKSFASNVLIRTQGPAQPAHLYEYPCSHGDQLPLKREVEKIMSSQTLLKKKHRETSKELLANLANEIDLKDEKIEGAANVKVYPNINIRQSFLNKKGYKGLELDTLLGTATSECGLNENPQRAGFEF
ncbi:Sulfate transporter 1.1 [Capsicum annuum]|uniref:Sulfate transporter 1.1 n=1 Tax=Capsicum annuum TaxID=4072 RepID=A0A2G2YDS7_CAPAN|nr:Sulfate transporter 1.1 [Capsicum annuum]